MEPKGKRDPEEIGELESVAEAAKETESELDQREWPRFEAERDEQQDLNQGMETGTHDAPDPSIEWGPCYEISENTLAPKRRANEGQKDSDTKK